MIEKEIKSAVKKSGKTFKDLEIDIYGRPNRTLGGNINGWATKLNSVLKLINYELTIKRIDNDEKKAD